MTVATWLDIPQCLKRDWLIGEGGWVVGRGLCVIAHASSRRLLFIEFKGTVFLYTTLRIHGKVSLIKFSKADLSAKYFLPSPLLFSCILLAHSLVPSCPQRFWMWRHLSSLSGKFTKDHTRFQTSSGNSHSANWPEYEAASHTQRS